MLPHLFPGQLLLRRTLVLLQFYSLPISRSERIELRIPASYLAVNIRENIADSNNVMINSRWVGSNGVIESEIKLNGDVAKKPNRIINAGYETKMPHSFEEALILMITSLCKSIVR
jgi:hypothetical protein